MLSTPAPPLERGSIRSLPHYMQGKLVQSSSWRLPRNITPSDVDLVFDNGGHLLLCELSSSANCWANLSVGQRRLYEAFCRLGCVAALLKHSISPPRLIDSRNDIDSFSLMYLHVGRLVTWGPLPGDLWPSYVEQNFFPTPLTSIIP